MDNSKQQILLSGASLALAKDARLVWQTFFNYKEKLEKDYQTKVLAAQEQAKATTVGLMKQIQELTGVGSDEERYVLDTRFADLLDVAVLYREETTEEADTDQADDEAVQ